MIAVSECPAALAVLFPLELIIAPGGRGLLCWRPDENADTIRIRLPHRFVRCIELLQYALEQDESEGLPPELCGFRKAEVLARLFSPEFRERGAIEHTTVTRYLSDLYVKLQHCGQPKLPLLNPFIERVKYMGARLREPIRLRYVQRAVAV